MDDMVITERVNVSLLVLCTPIAAKEKIVDMQRDSSASEPGLPNQNNTILSRA